jgi:hypothetical protein
MMRGELRRDDWVLTDIGDVEWYMLSQLPQAADASRSERGRRRLFPEVTDSTHEEICDDWRQFVQPEIADRFSQEIQTVAEDLQRFEEIKNNRGKETRGRLRIPLAHAEIWYSVLNQARLILNEDHEIAGAEHQLLKGTQHPTEIDEQRWLLLVQYRVYAAIQEFLLTELIR